MKLSTLFVDEHYRDDGIGTLLLSTCVDAWKRAGIDQAHVTVNGSLGETTGGFFQRNGFNLVATARGRYFCDQDELIYSGATDSLCLASPSWLSTLFMPTPSMQAIRRSSIGARRLLSLPAMPSFSMSQLVPAL